MKIIFAVIIAVIIIAAMAAGIYYYFIIIPSNDNSPSQQIKKMMQEQEKILQERYPDVIKGTLVFKDGKVFLKADNGKEYWLWPPTLISSYEAKGYKNGQKVEGRGVIMPNDRFYARILQ